MFDPVSLWMQSSLVWIKIFKQQQEMYLRMLGSVAQSFPHENAAELSREAEALKHTLTPAGRGVEARPVSRPAPKSAAGTKALASA